MYGENLTQGNKTQARWRRWSSVNRASRRFKQLSLPTLSGRAIKLLYDIAMQYNTYNNGALLASWRYMSEKRGWTSSDSLAKAKMELLERELIVQTVQGQLPNKASWYGLTWLALDKISGLEVSATHWPRGIYARWQQTKSQPKRKAPANIKSCLVRTSDT